MRIRLPIALLALLLAAGAGGCAGTPASTPASTGVSPSPAPAGSHTETAAPASASAPSGGWHAMGEPAVFRAAAIHRIVAVDGGFVAVGCTGPMDDCEAPAIWSSVDGLAWSAPTTLPLLPGELPRSAKAAVVVGEAVIVGGEVGRADRINAALWVAARGGAFERIADSPSFADGSIGHLLGVGDGVVAIGSGAYTHSFGFRAWHSSDGLGWIPAHPDSDDEASPIGVIGGEDGLVAWGPTCGVCSAETAFWRSADGKTWPTGRREIAGEFAHASAVGVTDAGLVAFGTIRVDPPKPAAWFLAHGTDEWVPVPPPAQPERTSIVEHRLVGHGAILLGTSLVGDRPTGFVWLARPGEAGWRPPVTLPGVSLMGVLQDPARPERLVLVGQTHGTGRPTVGLWAGSVDWAP